jgi:glyoxylase-like metal-dependent hydrolase (beta-lactamase superfamily II)
MRQAHGISLTCRNCLMHQLAFDGVLDQMGFLSLFVLLGHLRLVSKRCGDSANTSKVLIFAEAGFTFSTQTMMHPIDTAQTDIQRHQFGRVTVFRGAKGGKYPDGNQIMIRGSDTLAALDTPIVANHIGAEFDATELVVMGHVHEDHMAGLHRLPDAQVFAHVGDLAALQSWEGLVATFGWADSAQADIMRSKLESEFFYAPRPDARGYEDGAVWELGQSQIRAIHMPGHTAGHSVLLIEPEGVAFIGDIDLTGFGPITATPAPVWRTFAAAWRGCPRSMPGSG